MSSLSLVPQNHRDFKVGSLHLDIISVGGYYTCIQLPREKIAIDMGVCSQKAISANRVFFTHPHPDHISAFIQHVSTREMTLSQSNTTYYIEEQHHTYLSSIINNWRSISRCRLHCTVESIQPKQHIPINKNLHVVPFRSVHRIPCMGYTFYRSKKRLKPQYNSCTTAELIALRKKNISIEDKHNINILSVTGDTTHDVFHQQPHILKSEVLITEVTFFCDRISPTKAKKMGHMHIEDILLYADDFQNTHIVIMHLSARYTTQQVESIIKKRLPQHLIDRIVLIPNEMIL